MGPNILRTVTRCIVHTIQIPPFNLRNLITQITYLRNLLKFFQPTEIFNQIWQPRYQQTNTYLQKISTLDNEILVPN